MTILVATAVASMTYCYIGGLVYYQLTSPHDFGDERASFIGMLWPFAGPLLFASWLGRKTGELIQEHLVDTRTRKEKRRARLEAEAEAAAAEAAKEKPYR
jgi:hypothetical protein